MGIIVRTARPEDAEAVRIHHYEVSLETDIDVPMRPDDLPTDMEQIEDYINHYLDRDNSTAIVAEVDGKIVGWVTAQGSKMRVFRHVAKIGIVVSREWRGQGIGTRLMEAVIEWARELGFIKRLELDVYTRNTGAIRMYERLGFVTEGCRRKALKHDDEYVDLYHMALLI